LRALAAAVTVWALVAAAAPAAAQEPLPPQGAAPAGTNDFGCKPPARHPYPVVLVHGTFLNMQLSWGSVAPALTRLGYCVFALDYGGNGTGDIPTSARQLKTFVDQVLARTGAAKVSLVGHSQGGMMPRYWMKNLGGASQVDDLVGFSPSNHGTTNPLAGPLGPTGCVACAQQAAGSEFISDLNTGDQTPGDASFTVVQTRNDEVVTPYDSAFLPAGGSVTNVLVQDRCPTDVAEHVTIPFDPVAIQWMLDALGRPGAANAAYEPDCSGQRVNSFPDSSSAPPGSGRGGGATLTTLVIGHVPRSAKTTRRKRLRLAVKAKGATVRHVVVSVRSARGKRLGRSSAVTVTTRRRAVVVKLRRALRPGRYELVAQGRDTVSGRAPSSTRFIRLR
jgi:triacylglycerol lipase